MTAKYELIKSVAEHKGREVGVNFKCYLLGTMTRDECIAAAVEAEHSFEELSKQLKTIPEECIEAVMLAVSGY